MKIAVHTKKQLSKLTLSILSAGILASCSAPATITMPTVKKGVHPLMATGAVTVAGTPFIEVNGSNFLLAKACVPGRSFGGDEDKRNFGGDEDKRNFGGDEDKRNFGGDEDKRNFGGDEDKRNFGGDEDKRNFGGDEDKRNFGGDEDKRNFGGDEDKRNFGGDEDKRDFGGDEDKRNFGGDEDMRNFGSAQNQYKCVFNAADNAVYVTGFVGNEVIRANPGDVFTQVNNTRTYVIFKL